MTPREPAPLKPAVFHILLALADRESHGYAIMQAVREQSGGHVPLRTGSFYRHLSKLIRDGLVVESADRPEARRPAPRRLLSPDRARAARARAASARGCRSSSPRSMPLRPRRAAGARRDRRATSPLSRAARALSGAVPRPLRPRHAAHVRARRARGAPARHAAVPRLLDCHHLGRRSLRRRPSAARSSVITRWRASREPSA